METKKEGSDHHHRSVFDGRFTLVRMTAVSIIALVVFNVFQFKHLLMGNKTLQDALNTKDELLKANDELLKGKRNAQTRATKLQDELEAAKVDLVKAKDELLRRSQNELTGNREHENNNADLPPAYASLLEEAERRADANFESSHRRGKLGVAIGPTEGEFRHTVRSLRNAKRIRGILDAENKTGIVKVAMLASPAHISMLTNCENNNNSSEKFQREACRLWANGTLVDDLIATKDDDYHYEIRDAEKDTAESPKSIRFILVEVSSYRLAPYETTLFIDSDAYPCPGFDKLFGVLLPKHNKKYWQLPVRTVGDFAIGMEQFPQDGYHKPWLGPTGNGDLERDYSTFWTRNTGAVLFHFGRKLAHVFAEYIPLVTQYLHNNATTPNHKVGPNDQMPFRQALYAFRKLRPDFVEMQLPMHSSCRSYPGIKYAGTDGFRNGMFPLLPDGTTRCSDCRCTPCLIAHTPLHFVTINGTKGWETE